MWEAGLNIPSTHIGNMRAHLAKGSATSSKLSYITHTGMWAWVLRIYLKKIEIYEFLVEHGLNKK